MVYTATVRGSGLEFKCSDKRAFRAAAAARRAFDAAWRERGLKGRAHVSISLCLGDTEIFRAHGMGTLSAFASFRDSLGEMRRGA